MDGNILALNALVVKRQTEASLRASAPPITSIDRPGPAPLPQCSNRLPRPVSRAGRTRFGRPFRIESPVSPSVLRPVEDQLDRLLSIREGRRLQVDGGDRSRTACALGRKDHEGYGRAPLGVTLNLNPETRVLHP